jgi:hypothetical protein
MNTTQRVRLATAEARISDLFVAQMMELYGTRILQVNATAIDESRREAIFSLEANWHSQAIKEKATPGSANVRSTGIAVNFVSDP